MCGQIIRHKELCAPIIKGDLNNGNHMKNNISSVIFIRIEITMFIIDEAVKYPFFFAPSAYFIVYICSYRRSHNGKHPTALV